MTDVVMMTNGPQPRSVDLPRPRRRRALLEQPSYYRYREELMTFLEEHERRKEKAA
jgi:nitrate/nitrite transport system ATP-binding protein